MNTKRYILRDPSIRDRLKVDLDSRTIDPDKPLEVLIRPYKKNKSAAQQALMWIWHKQYQNYFGNYDRDEHIRFKAEYLLPVLIRDRVMEGLNELLQDAQEQMRVNLDDTRLQTIYRMISTNWLNTKQMAEILTQYEQDTAECGLSFTTKCPEYYEALGKAA